ncbi:MAG TPA: ATP-dependent zinc metalloprotease FtsH [Alkalispirochaeta sp.]|nr:ATP-dependent zinc metalloprotease FtsH [Alkalispirochaeta sp.]
MSDNNNQQPPDPQRWRKMALFAVIPLLFLVPSLSTLFMNARQNTVPYSFFTQQLQDSNVQSITVQEETVRGVLRQEVSYQNQPVQEFETYIPQSVSGDYLDRIDQEGVEVNTLPTPDNSGLAILLNLLPFAIMIWIFVRMSRAMRQQGGGGMQGMFNVGKNKAKKFQKSDSDTKFSDVAGADSAKVELQEVVDFLRNPERYQEMGAEIPHGVLMVGPPGSGKTLIARAVAGEADVPFYSISGSDFVEMFVGVGASRVRDLFKDARENSPGIVFIDEIDSIGRQRGAGLGGGHDEREQTLNQLLSEMDGFDKSETVIVLAATNRPDVLDPALLRPGRFDRRITVPAPAVRDREAILKIHAARRPMEDDVDIDAIARSTAGFSGADLANLLNEASLMAARARHSKVAHEDILAARDKIVLGLERSGVVMSDEERRTVAYHEAGHALVAVHVPQAEPVHKVTIIPRERAMGLTEQLPEGDKYLYRRDYITDRLAVMMGGRAAEAEVMGEITSGAASDLKQSYNIARQMVLEWGMSERFGNVAFGSGEREVFLGSELGHQRQYSDSTAREIDDEVREILNKAYSRAIEIVQTKRDGLDKLAEALLEKEQVTREQVEELLGVR